MLSGSKFFESWTLAFKNVRISEIEAICLSKTRVDLPTAFLIPPKSLISIKLHDHPPSAISDCVTSSTSDGIAISFSAACR